MRGLPDNAGVIRAAVDAGAGGRLELAGRALAATLPSDVPVATDHDPRSGDLAYPTLSGALEPAADASSASSL